MRVRTVAKYIRISRQYIVTFDRAGCTAIMGKNVGPSVASNHGERQGMFQAPRYFATSSGIGIEALGSDKPRFTPVGDRSTHNNTQTRQTQQTTKTKDRKYELISLSAQLLPTALNHPVSAVLMTDTRHHRRFSVPSRGTRTLHDIKLIPNKSKYPAVTGGTFPSDVPGRKPASTQTT